MLPDLPWVMAPSPTSAREPLVSRLLNRFEPDVVFTPMQTMGPFGRRFGLVTTVHDLIYYENRTPPRDLAWPIRLIWRAYHLSWAPQRALLARADAHATVSNTTRDTDAEAPSDEPSDHGRAQRGRPRRRRAGRRAQPATWSTWGRSCPTRTSSCWLGACTCFPGYTLHLLSRADDATVRRLTALAPAGSLRFHQGASDEEYADALSSATALVSASLNEGFGATPDRGHGERNARRRLRHPIFREIGAGTALFFDPASPEAFAAAVRRLEDPDEWQRRSDSAMVHSRRYSWDKSAAALLTALRAVADSRNSGGSVTTGPKPLGTGNTTPNSPTSHTPS